MRIAIERKRQGTRMGASALRRADRYYEEYRFALAAGCSESEARSRAKRAMTEPDQTKRLFSRMDALLEMTRRMAGW